MRIVRSLLIPGECRFLAAPVTCLMCSAPNIQTKEYDSSEPKWGGQITMEQSRRVFRTRLTFLNWPVWCSAVGCAATMLIGLEHGHEGSFYPLNTIMHEPWNANAAFGYRLLLPWLAVALQKVIHSLTDHNAFIATQVIAILAAVLLSGEWARLFLPRFGRPFGYAAATLMICPTINYWTFYDVATVAFWTGCLLLLQSGRLTLFVALLAVGTLNHENILLVVPCAAAYCWPDKRKLLLFTGAPVAAWLVVRVLVIHFAPAGALFDNRIEDNLHFWHSYSAQQLFFAWIALLPWWALAVLGWRYSPYLVKCTALSLPGLFLVTFLFGKFDEARQFLGFTPTCIGLMACRLRHQLGSAVETEEFARPAVVTLKEVIGPRSKWRAVS
jgi:hypothetical protein